MKVHRLYSYSVSMLLVCLLGMGGNAGGAEVQQFETPDGVKYGTWDTAAKQPAPTLFVLAGDIEKTLGSSYFRQCGNALAEHGWMCVSIDLPCHGKQTRAGEPAGLKGWSFRAAKQDDFVAENNRRLSSVLDHLIKSGRTDPKRVAACGTSRGGFLAIQFAAHDARVVCAAGFAPVTDLAALNEFQLVKDQPFVAKLSLKNQADKLAGRPVWIVIGDQDKRVGTDRAVALEQRLKEAAREKKLASRIQLHVMPEPRGHVTPQGSAERAADWILEQFPNVGKKN